MNILESVSGVGGEVATVCDPFPHLHTCSHVHRCSPRNRACTENFNFQLFCFFLFDFHFPSVWQSSPCKSHNGSIHPLCFHSSISFLCESVIMTKTMQWFFGSWSNCPLTVSALVITVDGSFLTLAIVAGTVGALEIGKRVDTATLVPPWQYRRCHCLHPQSRVRRRTRTRRQRRRRRRRWQAWSLLLSQPLFGPF